MHKGIMCRVKRNTLRVTAGNDQKSVA